MRPDMSRLRGVLRQKGYSPLAWAAFLAGAWDLSRATARAHPALTRMWRDRVILRAATLPLLARALRCPAASPYLWGIYVYQQADLYIHLGLNGAPNSSTPRTAFPLATECTLLRAYAAAALLAGTTAPRRALALGVATDILDGYLARRTRRRTRLGAYLDGAYDALLLLAAARAARWRHDANRYVEYAAWLRVGGTAAAGLVAYVALPDHVAPMASTWPGRLAGGVQTVALVAALSDAPPSARPSRRWSIAMALSAIAAIAAQVARYRRALSHTSLTNDDRRAL